MFASPRLPLLLVVAAAPVWAQAVIELSQATPAPEWAIAERALLAEASEAVGDFYGRYVDERGYLKCLERWGGNDGADDAMENFEGWTLLYALGGDENVLSLYEKAWEGHLRQYTEAKVPGIEMAENGMYWREFVTSFDWEHTGEALAAFHLYALARPDDARYRERVMRFADFYTGRDPQADNYDTERHLIKSIHNGSRGAKLTPATEMDWGGLPVEGAPDRLTRYATASNIKGDHPLNFATTALGFNAFLLSREERFRDWTLEYLDAWRTRIYANDGNIPTNIGLDGTIGGEWEGKWYGGVFGWDFDPESGSRNYFIRGPRIGFGIGLLLSGDRGYMEPLRRQIANLYAAKRVENGRVLLPRKYGDDGWYSYSPNEYPDVQRDIYLFTFDRTNLEGLSRDPWIQYLDGKNPSYPVEALRQDREGVRRRVEGMRADESVDFERASDYTQRFNPARNDALVNLALGGNAPGHSGNILHSRLFYLDPARSRPGLPEDVAALVESITPEGVRVRLVNLDAANPRDVVVRAGAYGEHQFTRVNGETADDNALRVRLAPGAGGTLELGMKLFANSPTAPRP
jgi:hypothetical protein